MFEIALTQQGQRRQTADRRQQLGGGGNDRAGRIDEAREPLRENPRQLGDLALHLGILAKTRERRVRESRIERIGEVLGQRKALDATQHLDGARRNRLLRATRGERGTEAEQLSVLRGGTRNPQREGLVRKVERDFLAVIGEDRLATECRQHVTRPRDGHSRRPEPVVIEDRQQLGDAPVLRRKQLDRGPVRRLAAIATELTNLCEVAVDGEDIEERHCQAGRSRRPAASCSAAGAAPGLAWPRRRADLRATCRAARPRACSGAAPRPSLGSCTGRRCGLRRDVPRPRRGGGGCPGPGLAPARRPRGPRRQRPSGRRSGRDGRWLRRIGSGGRCR